MPESRSQQQWNRRSFLGIGAAALAAGLVPARAQARTAVAAKQPERFLSFFNTHTGERLKTAYCCGGEYQPDALKQIQLGGLLRLGRRVVHDAVGGALQFGRNANPRRFRPNANSGGYPTGCCHRLAQWVSQT